MKEKNTEKERNGGGAGGIEVGEWGREREKHREGRSERASENERETLEKCGGGGMPVENANELLKI